MSATHAAGAGRNLLALAARVILLAAAGLYVMIGQKFALNPDPAGSAVAVTSAVGRTDLRAGLGGFPLGIAATLVFCLVTRRTAAGLAIALGITAMVLAVRLAGAGSDDTLIASARLLTAETVLVVLCGLGLLLIRRHPARVT
jgi:hypothetical protein